MENIPPELWEPREFELLLRVSKILNILLIKQLGGYIKKVKEMYKDPITINEVIYFENVILYNIILKDDSCEFKVITLKFHEELINSEVGEIIYGKSRVRTGFCNKYIKSSEIIYLFECFSNKYPNFIFEFSLVDTAKILEKRGCPNSYIKFYIKKIHQNIITNINYTIILNFYLETNILAIKNDYNLILNYGSNDHHSSKKFYSLFQESLYPPMIDYINSWIENI